MRGLTRVAAALLSTLTSALVLPSPPGSASWPASDGRIDHGASEAKFKLAIEGLDVHGQHPVLDVLVTGVSEECGESDVRVNGQQLDVQWEGTEASGRGILDAFAGQEAFWTITCLDNLSLSRGVSLSGQHVVHLLRLTLGRGPQGSPSGFTISYVQARQPALIRSSPRAEQLNDEDLSNVQWREFLPALEVNDLDLTDENLHSKILTFSDRYLKPSLEVVNKAGKAVKEKFGEAAKKLGLCQKFMAAPRPSEADQAEDWVDLDADQTTPTEETVGSTNTIPSHSATETRSLSETVESFAASSTLPYAPVPDTQADGEILKIIGLSLLVLSLFSWFLLRCRDPRWRADRAARREERHTKRLYRRAARQQKINNWIWSFRMKYKLASPEVLRWDEKRNRVDEQEAVLDDVMTQDIRALRRAHRVVSDVTAAEEGQNAFEYDVEASRRRGSVSTLPGYQSDATDPPAYDALSEGRPRSLPGDNDSDPASSIVSTSPRLSRDGTNSDFDEKFEVISLDARGLSNTFRASQHV